jgi:peroxiredoxin
MEVTHSLSLSHCQTTTTGEKLPAIELKTVGGGSITLGTTKEDRWALYIGYRGLHCPLCNRYIAKYTERAEKLEQLKIDVYYFSMDPEERATESVEKWSIPRPVGYGLSEAEARSLGLYLSDKRPDSAETDVFSEPGFFLINPQGTVHIVDVSNAPFSRPDVDSVLGGIEFIQGHSYPIRGTHK